ncbi:hypothetical protein MOMUL_01690 [Moorella mulderi DSM 14980]|uniref:Uncharacterized protein n=1 Tax=Moorella mulderi DSM 14980 TaxID=1122241 RepID=A0A151B0P6_9FIRM|nr:hypothetical protein MOMUL_01690 [Moorella mulderi DSM 14980]
MNVDTTRQVFYTKAGGRKQEETLLLREPVIGG